MLRRLLEWIRPRRCAPLLRAAERLEATGPSPAELVTWAETCLRAGLTLRLDDLERLTYQELVALAAARRRIELQRVSELAAALSSPLGAAAALEEVDGGEALDEALIGAGLELLERRR